MARKKKIEQPNIKARSKKAFATDLLEKFNELYKDSDWMNLNGESLSMRELKTLTMGRMKEHINTFNTFKQSINPTRESKKYRKGDSEYSEKYFMLKTMDSINKMPLRKQLKVIRELAILMEWKDYGWRAVKYTFFT